jgi:hypothetical protein
MANPLAAAIIAAQGIGKPDPATGGAATATSTMNHAATSGQRLCGEDIRYLF